jgi:hypothetical protein
VSSSRAGYSAHRFKSASIPDALEDRTLEQLERRTRYCVRVPSLRVPLQILGGTRRLDAPLRLAAGSAPGSSLSSALNFLCTQIAVTCDAPIASVYVLEEGNWQGRGPAAPSSCSATWARSESATCSSRSP